LRSTILLPLALKQVPCTGQPLEFWFGNMNWFGYNHFLFFFRARLFYSWADPSDRCIDLFPHYNKVYPGGSLRLFSFYLLYLGNKNKKEIIQLDKNPYI